MGAVQQIGTYDKGKLEIWLAHEEESEVTETTDEEREYDKCSSEREITQND